MKTCSKCRTSKPFSAFHVRKASLDGLQGKCKQCVSADCRESYPERREAQIASAMARQAINREIVQPCKSHPCTDCGLSFHPFMMDFDHVRGVKIRSVSQLVARCASPTTILAEIAKCDLVCSNCHRKRTWNRNNPNDQILV